MRDLERGDVAHEDLDVIDALDVKRHSHPFRGDRRRAIVARAARARRRDLPLERPRALA